ASWLAAIGCLYIVGLTVSRGTLSAIAVASIIALRRLLKNGFLPLLILCILIWVLAESGMFAQMTSFYGSRANEETGRFLVWPLVIARFLDSPLIGVGVSNSGTFVPLKMHEITPHNALLFVALTSGIVPLVFFVLYWWRAARGALRAQAMMMA